MGKVIDEIGNTYGSLTVLRRATDGELTEAQKRSARACWLCQCECGDTTVTMGTSLRYGNTTSCGCHRHKFQDGNKYNGRKYDARGFASYLGQLKHGARKREIDFELTPGQVQFLSEIPCHYCGAEPDHEYYQGYVGNGIDRIDSNGGYTMDNAVPCCKTCNYAKKNLSLDEFTDWAARLSTHLFEARG